MELFYRPSPKRRIYHVTQASSAQFSICNTRFNPKKFERASFGLAMTDDRLCKNCRAILEREAERANA